jgi:hypothetical protein
MSIYTDALHSGTFLAVQKMYLRRLSRIKYPQGRGTRSAAKTPQLRQTIPAPPTSSPTDQDFLASAFVQRIGIATRQLGAKGVEIDKRLSMLLP